MCWPGAALRIFCQYGLRAQEREPAEFDSRFYGTFVHDVLEYIVQQTEREGGFAAVPRSRVQELAQERMEQNAQTLLETFRTRAGRAICSGGRLTR